MIACPSPKPCCQSAAGLFRYPFAHPSSVAARSLRGCSSPSQEIFSGTPSPNPWQGDDLPAPTALVTGAPLPNIFPMQQYTPPPKHFTILGECFFAGSARPPAGRSSQGLRPSWDLVQVPHLSQGRCPRTPARVLSTLDPQFGMLGSSLPQQLPRETAHDTPFPCRAFSCSRRT